MGPVLLTRSHEWWPSVVGFTSATGTASAEHWPSSMPPTSAHSLAAADASSMVSYSTSTRP